MYIDRLGQNCISGQCNYMVNRIYIKNPGKTAAKDFFGIIEDCTHVHNNHAEYVPDVFNISEENIHTAKNSATT